MQNFKISFTVEQKPNEVFDAINNVPDWWGQIEGNSHNVGDEFTYRHSDMHYSKHRITEMIAGAKVVWLTVDSELKFVKQSDEWTGSTIIFEISGQADSTLLMFTHEGLTPEQECYDACSGAWGFYVGESLKKLITTGQGQPDL